MAISLGTAGRARLACGGLASAPKQNALNHTPAMSSRADISDLVIEFVIWLAIATAVLPEPMAVRRENTPDSSQREQPDTFLRAGVNIVFYWTM